MATLSYLQQCGRPHVAVAGCALWECHTDPEYSAAVALLEPQIENVRSSSHHVVRVTHTG